MERDFWNGIRPLGHMPLLVPPMKGLMIMTDIAFRAKGYPGNTALYAKGEMPDGATAYLWATGNYEYAIEKRGGNPVTEPPEYANFVVTKNDRKYWYIEGTYEDAMSIFEKEIVDGSCVML